MAALKVLLSCVDRPLRMLFPRAVALRHKPHHCGSLFRRFPPETAAKLATLREQLDLVYGAIDLSLTPEGHYVFLEINPVGQFLYIENATGQPIAATLAETLLSQPQKAWRIPFEATSGQPTGLAPVPCFS